LFEPQFADFKRRPRIGGIEPPGFLEPAQGLVETAEFNQHAAKSVVQGRPCRIKPDGLEQFRPGGLRPAHFIKQVADVVLGHDIVGIEARSFPILGERFGGQPLLFERHAVINVSVDNCHS